jgi:predicted GIY-YIG superfamily endonuclease
MHLALCSQSVLSVVVSFLRAPLAPTIAIAIGSMANLVAANAADLMAFSEEIADQTVPAPSQATPLDAFGYLGGLFEARFYQAHATSDDPRDEIREAASLYGLDLAMMMSIAKVESDFDPRVRTGSYKGLFQLSDYEFGKYGDGSIWDARDNARAAAHMFLVQAERFRWALGHYPDYAERYMVHQQGIQGAIEHYTHPERVAWQSMCATDEGVLKGEHWCKKCIWGNLLPEWQRVFGNVDNIQSGDFIALWTERIDHFADRYSAAPADAVQTATPNAGRRTAAAHSNVRALRSHNSKLRAHVVLAGRTHPRLSPAKPPAHSSVERPHGRV